MQAIGYDPATGGNNLPETASIYSKFHELAHGDQHRNSPVMFIIMISLSNLWVIGYFITLWIEFDAMRRAKRKMMSFQLWDRARSQEAWRQYRTYIWR